MKKTKVLFCSPYSYGENVISGGISIWGKIIVDYSQIANDESLEIIPISFDRKRKVMEVNDFGFKRFYSGFREISKKCKEVRKKMDYHKPDVMHLCTSASLGLLKDFLLLRLASHKNIKKVLHLHFGRVPDLVKKNNWEWKLLSKVLKMSDKVIAMDKKTYRVLCQKGFDNIVYVPNPLSLDIIDKVKEFEVTIHRVPKQLLFVGHALKTKGVYELVEGCVGVEGINLRLVGKISSEIKNDLFVLAQKRDNAEWLTFVGEISHDDVLKELMAADAFVFPSYTEGFPNVILEAMACGCPIAASNVGAIPEMLNIEEDACGICYEAKSFSKVRDAVKILMNDAEQKNRFAEKAKKRVNDMYAVPVVWRQLVKVWKAN